MKIIERNTRALDKQGRVNLGLTALKVLGSGVPVVITIYEDKVVITKEKNL